MEKSSTLVLKGVIYLLGLVALALCLVGLPIAIKNELAGDFDYLPLLIGLYAPAPAFFIALAEALKLLKYIDQNKAFSDLSVLALKKIKYCALVISGVFAIGLPYIFTLAEQDDAPGVMVIGMVFVAAPLVIATFASLLQKLLKQALEIKSENDLTV